MVNELVPRLRLLLIPLVVHADDSAGLIDGFSSIGRGVNKSKQHSRNRYTQLRVMVEFLVFKDTLQLNVYTMR